MIQFHLDRGSPMPAYAQIVEQTREALRLGWLQPGDQLPTVREVVAAASVNPNTVLKAYRELSASGLVATRQGSGTFVIASLGTADDRTLRRLRQQLDVWIAAAREAGLEREDMEALTRAALQSADGAAGVVA